MYVFVPSLLSSVPEYFIGHGTVLILSDDKEIIAIFISKWKSFFLTWQRDISIKKSGEPGKMALVCNSYHFEGWVRIIAVC